MTHMNPPRLLVAALCACALPGQHASANTRPWRPSQEQVTAALASQEAALLSQRRPLNATEAVNSAALTASSPEHRAGSAAAAPPAAAGANSEPGPEGAQSDAHFTAADSATLASSGVVAAQGIAPVLNATRTLPFEVPSASSAPGGDAADAAVRDKDAAARTQSAPAEPAPAAAMRCVGTTIDDRACQFDGIMYDLRHKVWVVRGQEPARIDADQQRPSAKPSAGTNASTAQTAPFLQLGTCVSQALRLCQCASIVSIAAQRTINLCTVGMRAQSRQLAAPV